MNAGKPPPFVFFLDMKNIAIKENHLYKKTYDGGKKSAGSYCVIYCLKDKKAYLLKKQHPEKKTVNRIGLTVGKKIGGAVQRNRVKRVLRAAFAECERELELKKGYLIVIAARGAALEARSTEIAAEMKRQLARVGLCAENTQGEES